MQILTTCEYDYFSIFYNSTIRMSHPIEKHFLISPERKVFPWNNLIVSSDKTYFKTRAKSPESIIMFLKTEAFAEKHRILRRLQAEQTGRAA